MKKILIELSIITLGLTSIMMWTSFNLIIRSLICIKLTMTFLAGHLTYTMLCRVLENIQINDKALL